MALTVSRKRLLESGDINLSGDRYRVAVAVQSKWPVVKLGEVCSLEYGSSLPERNRVSGPFPVVGSNGIAGFHKDFTVKGPAIVVGRKGSAGEVTWIDQDCVPIDTTYYVCIKQELVLLRYLFYTLEGLRLTELRGGAGVPGLNRNDAYEKGIPLPPLSIQRQIVAELDGYRNVIEGARQVLANYKPTIKIDPTWPIKPLGEVITLQRGYDLPKTQFIEGPIPVVGSNGIIGYHNVAKEKGPGVVTGRSGTIGKVHFIEHDYFWPHNTALFVKEFNENDRNFIKYLLESIDLKSLGDNVAAVPSLDRKNAHRIPVPLPPLSIQREIVAELEAERALVEANRKLAEIFEAKIKARLDELWGAPMEVS